MACCIPVSRTIVRFLALDIRPAFESRIFKNSPDLRAVTDRDDLHGLRIDVFPQRDALDIGGGRGHELRGIRIPVVLRKIVDACESAHNSPRIAGILQREREAGDDGALRHHPVPVRLTG